VYSKRGIWSNVWGVGITVLRSRCWPREIAKVFHLNACSSVYPDGTLSTTGASKQGTIIQ